MHIRLKLLFICLLLMLPIHSKACASASEDELSILSSAPYKSRVTIVTIPGFSFLEMEQNARSALPSLYAFTEKAAIGAMNIRTPGRGPDDSYLTMGAGTPGESESVYMGWNAAEMIGDTTIGEHYRRYAGLWSAPSQGQSDVTVQEHAVLVPEIDAIRKVNQESAHHAIPGLLGEQLEQAGIKRYVFGNSDRLIYPSIVRHMPNITESVGLHTRYAPLLIMNQKGVIDHGDVGKGTTLPAVDKPLLLSTHYAELLRQWGQTEQPSVVVVELGDLHRLYREQHAYTQEAFVQAKETVLREMDRFIGELSARLGTEESLWIISPEVNADAKANKLLLAPAWLYDPAVGSGLLYSSTTRRIGIFSLIDLAPSVLAQFGLTAPKEMLGLPIYVHSGGKTWDSILQDVHAIRNVYVLRPNLLYAFMTFEIIVLLLTLFLVWTGKSGNGNWLKIALYSILIAPFVLLIMGLMSNQSVMWLCFFFIISSFGLGWIISRYALYPALIGASGITAFAIVVDGFLGAEAMKSSVMGYDPMVGARYYGIGNEFMGVLIGAVILAVSTVVQVLLAKSKWIDREEIANGHDELPASPILSRMVTAAKQKSLERIIHFGLASVFLLILFYFAAPSLGTNAGGAITAAVAFGIAWLRICCRELMPHPLRWGRLALLLLVLLAASLALLWLLNAVLPHKADAQSHIGRALQLFSEGRYSDIGRIIRRKLEMNLHLIHVSSWSKVLITCLGVTAVIVLRPLGVFREWQSRCPYIMYGFSAIAIGGIVGLLVNDSGVVAAATMYVYVAVPMLLLKLQDSSDSHSS